MDCKQVRDRFSSLWEKELTPIEKKIIDEHLSSCPACQGEFEQFEKTMRWLHSVEEVEVPDGFLSELQKKMEERKRIPLVEKAAGKSFHLPFSLKLPAQAVAMVAVVFLVLYFTKMMPTDIYHQKEDKETSSSLSLKEKSEQVLPKKEPEGAPGALKMTPEISSLKKKEVEQTQATVPREEKFETHAPQVKAEAKRAEPSPKMEAKKDQTFDFKEAARTRVASSELEKVEKGMPAQEPLAVAPKPPQEIVLRISDREKAISQLQELVKQFGGEVVATEGNRFLASLPTGSFPEFKKELAGWSAPVPADKAFAKKPGTGNSMAVEGTKKEEVEEKSKKSVKPANGEESRTIVRILLIQE